MKPKISVVIPVYNVEKYLNQCILSLLNQTYENYEVILVDDGSTDKSGELCDKYSVENSKVKVYHSVNKGMSAARNFGVDMADGEYITFVDSDDWVTEDYLSYLYSLIQNYKVDIAGAKMKRINCLEEANIKEKNTSEQCLNTAEALKKMCYGDIIGVSPCAKLYKKEILLKNPYPLGKIHEDVDTTYKIISSCSKIAIGSKLIYFYLQRSGSTIHQPLQENQFYGMEAAINQLKYVQKYFPSVEQAAQVRCAMKALEYIPMLMITAEKQKEFYNRIREFLRPHMSAVMKDKFVNNYFKIRCIFVMAGYFPLKVIWPLSEYIRKYKSKRY